jgi:hypothetical protein
MSAPCGKVYPNGEYDFVRGKPAWFQAGPEVRAPRKGEWYVSGAIPAAYRAPNDLDTPYRIAHPIPDPPKTIRHGGFIYRLERAA